EAHARVPGSSPARHIRAFADRLKAVGVRLCGSPVVPVPPPAGFESAHCYAPTASAGPHSLAVGALAQVHPAVPILLGLVSPARADWRWAFAVNGGAFDIVGEPFGVGEKGSRDGGGGV